MARVGGHVLLLILITTRVNHVILKLLGEREVNFFSFLSGKKMSTNKLSKRNLFSTLLLGFSSGLPLALTSSTLQAWFTVTGASLLAIGSLSLIGQPYVYKFLWA